MRVNVYAEDLARAEGRMQFISKHRTPEGVELVGVRLFFGPAEASDAVTFWERDGQGDLRQMLQSALDAVDEHYRNYPAKRGYGE